MRFHYYFFIKSVSGDGTTVFENNANDDQVFFAVLSISS